MSKQQQFLSSQNKTELIRRIYSKYTSDGGQSTIANISDQIDSLMQNWIKINLFDSYESLVHDGLAELEAINNEFIRKYTPEFTVGDNYKTIKRLSSPADYHNMDTTPPEDVVVTNTMYRFNNTIPLYQLHPERHYDRSSEGSGLTDRDLEQDVKNCGDMAELLDRTNDKYQTIDTDDVTYYGQHADDTTSSLTGLNYVK